MPQITDIQAILLKLAARRENRSLYPLPETLQHPVSAKRSISALVKRGFVQEQTTTDTTAIAYPHNDADYGVFITAAGHAAIGMVEPDEEAATDSGVPAVPQIVVPTSIQPTPVRTDATPTATDALTADAAAKAKPGADHPTINLAPTTKTATILALLRRDDGASLDELVEATRWLPHTTRAVLTGLRKKGHILDKSKRDGLTRYRIVAA